MAPSRPFAASRSVIAGAGGYLPGHLVTNDDLAATVDTTDAWIRERTGIRQRYRVGPTDTTTSMAAAAARRALEMAGATAADVDLIIVGTSTPDQAFPSVAVAPAISSARRAAAAAIDVVVSAGPTR
jgi:3-oxoacyl-[acyl-carrier-protein] synthase-3